MIITWIELWPSFVTIFHVIFECWQKQQEYGYFSNNNRFDQQQFERWHQKWNNSRLYQKWKDE